MNRLQISWSALVLVTLLFLGCSSGGGTAVRVAKPERADIVAEFLATGNTEAREIEVAAQNYGNLEEIRVEKDDTVQRGDILAVASDIDGENNLADLERNLAVQRSAKEEIIRRLDLRRTQIATQEQRRRAENRRARAEYEQKTAGVTEETIQQAQASVDEAKAQLRQSRREKERLEKLFEEDIASQAQVEKAQMEEEIALARRTRALKKLEELQKGPTAEQMAAARAELEVSNTSLQENQEADLELSLLEQQLRTKELDLLRLEGQVAKFRERVSMGKILAPAAGQVITVHRQPGELVQRGTPIVTLLDPDQIWVEGDVAEQESSYVSVGQEVSVNLPSFEGRTLKGRIESVAPALRTPLGSPGNARFLQIKVSLEEQVEGLLPGIEADIEGRKTLAEGVLTIPQQAVVRDQGKTYVVAAEQNKARRIEVELGVSDEEKVEVKSDLDPTLSLVIDNPSRLQDGDQVNELG